MQLSDLPDVVPLLVLPFVLLALLRFLAPTGAIWRLPTPALPLHRRYTVGHNLIHLLVRCDPTQSAAVFNDWRAAHGDTFLVRSLFGAPCVFFTSAAAVRELTITKQASFIKPGATRAVIGAVTGERGLLLTEGAPHARLRRAVAPALHHASLISHEGVFLESGAALAARLGGEAGDTLRWAREAAFIVILEACFGEDGVPRDMIDKLREAYVTVFYEPPARALVRIVLTSLFPFASGVFQYRRDLKLYLRQTIHDLCRQAAKRDTILATLATGSDNLEYVEMVDTVLSFLVAGQATTSLSVCWTLHLLAHHPVWQQRVCDELVGWSAADGLAPLDGLPVLDRVVRESIRLYPPVPSTARDACEDVSIDGHEIPKGCSVRIPTMAMQRARDIWGADADEFNPDRFLDPAEVAKTRMFWGAFSFGPHGCIGQRFALLEIKAFIAQVLKRLRVYVKPDDPPPGIFGPLCTPKDMKLYYEERVGA